MQYDCIYHNNHKLIRENSFYHTRCIKEESVCACLYYIYIIIRIILRFKNFFSVRSRIKILFYHTQRLYRKRRRGNGGLVVVVQGKQRLFPSRSSLLL